MPQLIDTHAHVNFNAFKDDSGAVMQRALEKDIWVINVGSQYSTSQRAVEYTEKYERGVYAAIGLHPIHLSQTEVDEEEIRFKTKEERFDKEKYQKLLSEKVVAIGETGLDYYHIPKDKNLEEIKEVQKQGFIEQLEFAKENHLPVILHCRGSEAHPFGAYDEMLEIIANLGNRGVIHCYGGSLEQANRFLDLGFLISFTGIITFDKKAENLQQIAKTIPLEKIMVETDCPYLAPEPHRGQRNEPAYVEFIARKIAEIKGIDYEEVAKQTTENAIKLFGLK